MKAGWFKKWWIILRSLWATLFFSSLIVCHRYTRKQLDTINQRWSKKILDLSKVSYQIFDPHHLKLRSDCNYIIMSNHASMFDIPVIVMTLPGSIRMIAKKELFRVPIWGHAMKKAGFISIDRKNRHQAVKDLESARHQMEQGTILWIAPEGTRSRTGQLGKFKKGGFVLAEQMKAIIIPVGLRNTQKILPPDSLDLHINQKVEVHIGQPIHSKDYPDRNQFMQKVSEMIQKLAGLEKNP